MPPNNQTLPTDSIPPTSPILPPVMPAPMKSGHGGLIISILIILILLGGGAYAYYEQLWIFSRPPYDTSRLASSIFAGVEQINTANYRVHLNVASEPRAADAKPFTLAVSQDTAHIEAYKRDQDKVRDLQNLADKLLDYYYDHNRNYPATLSLLGGDTVVANPMYKYAPTKNGQDYDLTVTFETAEAIDWLSKSKSLIQSKFMTIDGKKVTFTKESSVYFYIPNELKSPSLVDISSLQTSLAYIPGNLKIDLTTSAASQVDEGGKFNTKLHFLGAADLGDIKVDADVEFRKLDDIFYVIINKFPTFFFDISKLKEKWIKIMPTDLATYGSSYFGSSPEKTQEKITEAREQTTEAVKLFLTIADRHQALVARGVPKKENIGDIPAYRYELEFSKEKLPTFYQDLTDEFQKKYAEKNVVTFNQATLDYLKSPEFNQVFDYFRQNTALTIWADQNGVPVQAQYRLRVVPESKGSQLPDRQVSLALTLTLSDINQPLTIEEPPNSISVEEATIAMTGQTKEQYQFEKQIKAIQTLSSQLRQYKELVGSYPQNLNDLKKTRGELKKIADPKLVADPNYPIYGQEAPLMKDIPQDIFTNQPFQYLNKGEDYALIYTIKLPNYQTGSAVDWLYRFDYSNKKSVMVLKAISGKNTANSKTISEEASAQSKIDSDGDNLPDVIEVYIGTDKNKKDSDGDTYSDYDEVTRRTNPLGPGNLKSGGYGSFGL